MASGLSYLKRQLTGFDFATGWKVASPLSSYSRSPAILSVEDIGNGSRSCSCAAGPERPSPQETCGGVINVSDLDWSNHLFSRVLDPRRSSSRALNPRFQLTTSRPLYANPSQTSKTCITVIHLWSRRENTNSADARHGTTGGIGEELSGHKALAHYRPEPNQFLSDSHA